MGRMVKWPCEMDAIIRAWGSEVGCRGVDFGEVGNEIEGSRLQLH
jgi:hypothetical protein